MSDNERKALQKEIFDYGEVEREAARNADFVPQGGLVYRLMKWVERKCREERELLRQELKELDNEQQTPRN